MTIKADDNSCDWHLRVKYAMPQAGLGKHSTVPEDRLCHNIAHDYHFIS